jgi:hypothetical protein
VALTIAELEQEMQVPGTHLCVPRNPFYAIGGRPPTSESAPAAQPPECQRATNIH